MIKTLALIKRRPDLDRAEFRNHYETSHAPLALPHMKGLMRYVRYHIEEDLLGDVGEVDFDVLSAFWYRDAESIAAMMEVLAGEAGKPILADELKFMDKPANVFFPVSESWLQNGEEGESQIFILVAKPETVSRYDCAVRLLRELFPELLEGFESVEFALVRDAFPLDPADPADPSDSGNDGNRGENSEAVRAKSLPWNAVLQVRAQDYAGLEEWAGRAVEEGYRVVAVRARRFETTDLPIAD